MKVKSESEVTQLYPTLCDPMDCSPPGSSVHESLQARILEWVAISSSRAIGMLHALNSEDAGKQDISAALVGAGRASQVALVVKNLPAMQETQV